MTKPGSANRNRGLHWPDYVLAAAILAIVFMLLTRMLGGDGESALRATEAEKTLISSVGLSPDDVWTRAERVMRRQGHLTTEGPTTLEDLREGIKAYQHVIGEPRTGILDRRTLDHILEDDIEIAPPR